MTEEKTNIVEETVEKQEVEPKEVFGEVVHCDLLNVRTAPNKKATVKTTIEVGEIVKIDESGSTDTWYKVRTGDYVEGFCMKQYIAVQS